jgi:hypothetical protein
MRALYRRCQTTSDLSSILVREGIEEDASPTLVRMMPAGGAGLPFHSLARRRTSSTNVLLPSQ